MRKMLFFVLVSLSSMVFAYENDTRNYIEEFKNIPVEPSDIATLSKMAEAAVIKSHLFLCGYKRPQYLNMDILESDYGPKYGFYSYKIKIYYNCER